MIDFSQPGWFRQYVAFRKEFPFRLRHPALSGKYYLDDLEVGEMRYALYFTLQSTGLLYGFPVRPPSEVPKEALEKLKGREARTAFIFLECLFATQLIYHTFQERDKSEYDALLDESADVIRDYYLGLQPGFQHPEKVENGFEEAFLHRLKTPVKFYKKGGFGMNSLLFWDVFYLLFYREAVKVPGSVPASALDAIQDYLSEMKFLSLETIIVAAHSSVSIEPEEAALFKQFLSSAGLSKDQEKRLKKHFKAGRLLEELEIPPLPWLARRYLLDTSLLTVMSDQLLTDEEQTFLQEIAEKLGFGEKELDESKTAFGIFMLRYGDQIPFLKKRPAPLALVSGMVRQNVTRLLGAVWAESVETKDMAITFGKLLSTRLRISDREDLPSPEEIRAAMDQLKDIPRFAPFFGIFFMPLPGITELYLLLAVTIEKMTDNKVQLLPTHFSNVLKGEQEEDELDWD
ncbi:MAG: hypothetical protein H6581_13955 [Bacteroidia bacterium]|nr:hypothetical protein [Bacteroidia bacterium]